MDTLYFAPEEHAALNGTMNSLSEDCIYQGIYDKLFELHRALYRRMREHTWDLHPHWNRAEMISVHSAATPRDLDGLVLSYFRSREQGQLVERLMGREGIDWTMATVETHRHPTIELRLTPDMFTVELVVSPASWWDQQNLIGKLNVSRHRHALRQLLHTLDDDFRFGFWEGTHLSDMHLTTRQLLRGSILDEWMSTFADGQDTFRVGVWYPAGDAALGTNRILSEMVRRVGALYSVYSFLLWTSNNDYINFYRNRTFTGMSSNNRL